ncbi:hypothetical protein Nepgr_015075 [Nepenthes gracilis]|uniref:Reverse transcriptase RNase H-like domain-containing protein n=1 Tax=Nepenthes gracilis TaxID=150966 RepID=A0AAD3SM94_NEPGR|nr:hypothetical protein Nepgr_015075 [Nepenthes gracilis]
MPGISAETMVHKLGLDLDRKPVRQKRRNHSVEKLIAIREEVKKLLDAGFIREVQYPDWLSNVVLVKKNNGKWRMCVDFTDVNRACPKDSFPLPRIDLLVDSTAGHELLSFMDAYSGYNQIRMSPDDEEHTSFMTDQGTYCYRVMPFGLKNAGATYSRSTRCSRTKSAVTWSFVPLPCEVWRQVPALFQGLTRKKVQRIPVNGGVPSCFRRIKAVLGQPAAIGVASRRGGIIPLPRVDVNRSILSLCGSGCGPALCYYVSKMLTGPETRYLRVEKLALALISSARRLRPYFQAHRIVVLTDQPLKTILQKPDVSGRLVKWAIELGEFDIEFQPRPAVKAQVLADFLVETTTPVLDEQPEEKTELLVGVSGWILHVDGSSTDTSSGAGVVLTTPDGLKAGQRVLRPEPNGLQRLRACR